MGERVVAHQERTRKGDIGRDGKGAHKAHNLTRWAGTERQRGKRAGPWLGRGGWVGWGGGEAGGPMGRQGWVGWVGWGWEGGGMPPRKWDEVGALENEEKGGRERQRETERGTQRARRAVAHPAGRGGPCPRRRGRNATQCNAREETGEKEKEKHTTHKNTHPIHPAILPTFFFFFFQFLVTWKFGQSEI